MVDRRVILKSGALLGGASALSRFFPDEKARSQRTGSRTIRDGDAPPPGEAGRDYTPVITPNSRTLPFEVVDGVKVMHLIAEEVKHEFSPGLEAYCWGYNGSVHGPTIEAVEGDQLRIYVTNRLSAPTTVHWHGLILPNGMDGVSGITQPPIPPGETWVYEFPLVQHGTHMYHSHHDTMTQEGLGMTGMFIIHPRVPVGPLVDRDFAILLHEWRIDPGSWRPNPNEMSDFNVLTMNARVFPATEALVVRTGQRTRIRIGNLSAMDHHPIHLHGYEFLVTAIDGVRVAEDRQTKRVTTLVGVGETRDIEFDAIYPGDWIFHCHMTHHIMNQMGHEFPNMVGMQVGDLDKKARSVVPGYMTMGTTGMRDMTRRGMDLPENSIPMLKGMGQFDTAMSLGGMANVLKVRDGITTFKDPGFYRHPDGTIARPARRDELDRDNIRLQQDRRPRDPMPGEIDSHRGAGTDR